jgi:hypothetical protein
MAAKGAIAGTESSGFDPPPRSTAWMPWRIPKGDFVPIGTTRRAAVWLNHWGGSPFLPGVTCELTNGTEGSAG